MKKELSSFQRRKEVLLNIARTVSKLHEGRVYILRQIAPPHSETILIPMDLDQKFFEYKILASQDNNLINTRMLVERLQFYDVIPWKKKYAPMTINWEFLTKEYKQKAFG